MNAAGGGAALSTLALMKALKERGIDSCAVCHDAGTPEERAAIVEETQGEVTFTPLYWWNRKTRTPGWKRPLSEAKQRLKTGFHRASAAKVATKFRQWNAELIHSNTLTTLEGAVASRWLDCPHVWHVRELVGPEQPFVFPVQGEALAVFLARHADVVVANSSASAAALRFPALATKLRVIPNGLELARFLRIEPRRSKPPVVAMVANLTSPVKKHGLFLDAASRVDASLGVEFRLYGHAPPVGAEPYADQIRSRAEAINARICGFQDPAVFLADIDVLVHPLESESFGRGVLEAMAAGKAVVGVDGGGVGELVSHGETGLLGPADDPVAMAQNITKLLSNGADRERMGQTGRQVARDKYDIGVCADSLVVAYSDAINAHSKMQSQLGLIVEWAWGKWRAPT
jgi:glycosyltransferase involved in cell wall biosynthesis